MRRWMVIIILLSPAMLWAQTYVSVGGLPEVNVSYRWSDWRISGQFETMVQAYSKHGERSSDQYELIRNDWTTFLTYRTGPHWSFGAGYLNRWTEGMVVKRFIQQASFVNRGLLGRVGHRIRTDQTFSEDEPMSFRFRYRVAVEIPLNGRDLNDGEWYFKASLEAINEFSSESYQFSYRVLPFVGYYLNRSHKLELGPDYRHTITKDKEIQAWMSVSYYMNIR